MSYHPVLTMETWRPWERSTVGPQAATNTAETVSNPQRRRTRIALLKPQRPPPTQHLDASRPSVPFWRACAWCALEHAHFDALQRLVARDLPRQVRGEVGAAQPDDARARIAVGRREARPIVVAADGDRQPFVRTDVERGAVIEHRVLQRRDDFGPVRLVGIGEDRVVARRAGGARRVSRR